MRGRFSLEKISSYTAMEYKRGGGQHGGRATQSRRLSVFGLVRRKCYLYSLISVA